MTTDILQEKILLIEDEADWMELLVEAVQKTGLPFLTATSAEDALAICKNEDIFLILADLVLPGRDGIWLCEEVRKSRSDLPFVLLSAKADRERVIQGLRASITDVVDKPFNNDAIQSLCRHHAQRRREVLKTEASEAEALLATFLDEARDLLRGIDESLINLEQHPDSKAEIDKIFRKIHTIKGSSGATKKTESLTRLAHAMESLLSRLKENTLRPSPEIIDLLLAATDLLSLQIRAIEGHGSFPPISEIVEALQIAAAGAPVAVLSRQASVERVDARQQDNEADNGVYVPTEKLDSFLEMVGELVAVKNSFYMFLREQSQLGETGQAQARDIGLTLDKVSERIQSQLMEVRKVALKKVFAKLPRIARQVSADLQKDAGLELVGEDVAVDKSIANVLSGCLSHAVRNSLDHGLESNADRVAGGKPSKGHIRVSAEDLGENIRIVVEDDGRGISREKVLAKAISSGLVGKEEAGRLSDAQVYAFIFQPGFSTAAQVTSISGRGVGMDAIYSSIESLGGKTEIESTPGKGSRLVMTLPVLKTINVERSILLESEGLLYAMPLKSVRTIKTLHDRDITPVKQTLSFQFQGRATRVATYAELSGKTRMSARGLDESGRVAVVMHSKNQNFALLVDRVVCQFDAIVRPFSRLVTRLDGFEGTAVVGNGRIAYVVQADEMINLALTQNLRAA